jgi:hypothetical protein
MRCGGTPGKPEFFAEQKMRPDDIADGADKLCGTLAKTGGIRYNANDE